METFLTIVFGIIGIIAVMTLLFTLPVMWLWNGLMPDLFNLPEIGFWQAMGLTLLCGILFKGGSSSSSK